MSASKTVNRVIVTARSCTKIVLGSSKDGMLKVYMPRKTLMRFLGWIVAALFLVGVSAYFVPRLNWAEIGSILRKTNTFWFSLLLVNCLAMWILRAHLVWSLTSAFSSSYRWWMNLKISLATVLWNRIVPLRAGSILRWFLMSRYGDITKSRALSILLTAGVLEMSLLIVIVFFALFALGAGRSLFDWQMILAFAIALFAFCGSLIFLRAWQVWIRKSFLGRYHMVECLLDCFSQVRHLPSLFQWSIIVLLIWISQILSFQLTSMALNVPLQLGQMIIVMAAMNLSVVFPVTPGNVGTIQVVVSFFLKQFGVPLEEAVAYSIIFHIGNLAPQIVAGSLASASLGINLSSALNAKYQA